MQPYQSLIHNLYDIGAVQFGEFTFKSGLTSSIYINLRKIISYPHLLQQVADAVWEKIFNKQFELICGVPYTALPIATCLSLKHNIPMVMRRKEKKDYGTKQIIEGVYQSNQSCLIIEDLITTGASILETTRELEIVELKINDVIALIDREQGGFANLSQYYCVHSVIKLTDLLTTLIQYKNVSKIERQLIEKYLLEKSA